MNTKRWLLASVTVLVVMMVLEFVIHGMLLHGIYQQTATVWRTQAEMQRLMWIGWYVILPIPLALSFYWFLAILVEFIAAGVAAGLVYRE